MKSRVVILFILLTTLWGVLLARAAWLQLWPDSRLKSQQKRQFETVVTLNSRRGDVLDRNGHELAVSMTSYSLFADPKLIEDPHRVAQIIAKEVGLPYRIALSRMKDRNRRFIWIRRHLDRDMREKIETYKIRGLGFIEEAKRIYPNETVLSHVLGFIGREGTGLEGLERQYNDTLQANKKKFNIQRDARGRPLIVNGQVFTQMPDGSDLRLTVDREMQFMLEQELGGAVARHKADSAVGIILDARTSEVLAMANAPLFNPNDPLKTSPDLRRNRTITDPYEPGSVMKSFVIAGALKDGLIEPNTKFDCEDGRMKIGNRTIREADENHRFKMLTVTEILAQSSNIGTTKIAFKMGTDRVRQTLVDFGFGTRSGVDLPGESVGILHPGPWRDHFLSNVSFGHGMAATALQIANGYAAIANGGVLRKPYIVKSVHDYESGETTEMKPQEIRRVLTEEQAAKVKLMLLAATANEGTGGKARVPGFPVAGKTGTAQKSNPNGRGYMPGAYISSFAGFLPVNEPRFVIYIAIDNPRKGYYGSQVAAPVFSRIARFAVRKAGLAPVLISQDNLVPKGGGADALEPVLTSADMRAQPALAALMSEIEVEKVAESPLTIGRQVASMFGFGSSIDERPSEKKGRKIDGQPVVVPELVGLSLREVLQRTRGTGIELNIKGSGYVINTFPPAGSKLVNRKKLTLVLAQAPEAE